MFKKELERKHKEDQEATARAFQEFIKTFQDTSGTPNKTFVKSGILNVKTGQEIQSQRGQIYNPRPTIQTDTSSTIKNAIECARLLKETRVVRVKGQEKPKTNLEILKEELKQRHLERGERIKLRDDLATYSASNVIENTDPTTTNLFIAHVSVKITENDLVQLFGSYGPLASVKIMWPKTDEKSRKTNCGFVAFMSRKDAERAMYHLEDTHDMKIGWGKPIEVPAHPIYVPPDLLKLFLPPCHTGLPFNAQPLRQQFKYPTTELEMNHLLYNSIVKVTIPLDKKVLTTIHRTVEFVIREGPLFEAIIMNKEINNPAYQFLFDNKKPEHTYYRWKLYSLMKGESYKKWSTEKFRMFKDGSVWSPPTIQDYTKGMPENLISSSARVEKSMLSDAQKNRFIQLIQTLNMSKKKIGEAMVFCLNHVEAVKDVIDIIVDSFMNDTTNASKKVARLYLLSDLLYNSSMKKCYAPIYGTEFEKHLPDVFKQLQITLKNSSLNADKEAIKYRVINVLRSWDLWKIYPNSYLNNLENIFLNVYYQSELDKDYESDRPLDCINLIKNDTELIKERSNRFDQDLIQTGFVPSKWELVDPDQVEAQAMSTKKFYDMELERQMREKKKLEQSNKELSEEERDTLRKVEIMVMQYQDDFESGKRKLKKGKSLEKELNNFRGHLLQRIKRCKQDVVSKTTTRSANLQNCSGIDKENRVMHKEYKKKTDKTRHDKKNRY